MPYVDRGDCRIHWQEAGEGTPVLLVMGAVYSSEMWYPVLPALAAKHRVIRYDNRGTGGSTATREASISDMARDGLAVLDAAGIETAHVYGVSLGGIVALELAMQAPERVRSLVLGCTGILSADKPRAPKWMNHLFWLPRKTLVSRTRYGSACPPEKAAKARETLMRDVRKRRGLVAQQNALRAYAVERDAVAALTMPSLVLHGTEDAIVPLAWGEELAATLPDSRLVTYEGGGHNYIVEVDDRANSDVLEFLEKADALESV
jgi:pimeloyl-ACP methyl ester carboxylesterase